MKGRQAKRETYCDLESDEEVPISCDYRLKTPCGTLAQSICSQQSAINGLRPRYSLGKTDMSQLKKAVVAMDDPGWK
jgi:hypothetical protein